MSEWLAKGMNLHGASAPEQSFECYTIVICKMAERKQIAESGVYKAPVDLWSVRRVEAMGHPADLLVRGMSGCPGLVGNDGSAARSTHCSTPHEQLEQRGVDQDRGDVGKSEHEGRPREEERVTRGDVANQVERDAGNDERRQGSNEREDAKNRQHQFHGLSEVRCWKNEARGEGQHDGCIDPRWPADAHAISFADDVGCQRRVVANCLTVSPSGGN